MKILAIADEECASLWDFFDKSKVADIDFAHPYSRLECSPLLFHISYLLRRLKLCVTLQDGGKSPIVLVLNSYNYIEYK